MRRRWAAIPGGMAAAALTLAACVATRIDLPAAPVAAGPALAVQTANVPLDPTDRGRAVIDGFTFAGGVAIASDQTSRLHGLSDLVVGADGRILSVTDDGDRFVARLVLDREGRLVGLTDAALVPLTDLAGDAIQGKELGDAEGVAQLGGGEMMVSFERRHRIWAYPGSGGRPPLAAPTPGTAMADNDGMEGLAGAPRVAADAYWVGVEPGGIWLCRMSADCVEETGLPRPPAGYRLSGLTSGPNGELIVLHHSYMPTVGSRIIVTVVRDPTRTKRVVGGFSLTPPLTVDNFEGVAVLGKPNGDWRLYLLSDDNFSAAQRTLLLAFDWTPPR